VPVSTLGREYFRHDEAAKALVGESSGTRYSVGDKLELKLAESNALTGSLKFEVPDSDGSSIEQRGNRDERGENARKKYIKPRRGRPGNIRHQGRRRKKEPIRPAALRLPKCRCPSFQAHRV